MDVKEMMPEERELENGDWLVRYCCPVCNTAWGSELEGEYEEKVCEHLKFIYMSEGRFEYYGKWDTADFEKNIKEAVINLDYDVEEFNSLGDLHPTTFQEALQMVESPGIDSAFVYIEDPFPTLQLTIIWGCEIKSKNPNKK